MATQKALEYAFHAGLKDIRFAERTSARALKKAAKAPEPKQGIESKKERLEQVSETGRNAATT